MISFITTHVEGHDVCPPSLLSPYELEVTMTSLRSRCELLASLNLTS